MKKILFTALIALTAFVSFAAPSSDKESKAQASFKKQFSGAQHINWSKAENGLHKVSFVWGGHSTVAYFTDLGEFMGSARSMFYDQLPLTVIRAVDEKYKNPVVIEVREISNEEGTSYSLVLEQKTKKYRIKVNSLGDVIESERIKK